MVTGQDSERFDVVLVAEAARVAEAEAAVALAGGRLLAVLRWDEAGELTARSLGRPVLALEAEGVPATALTRGLKTVRELAAMLDLPIVVTLARDQIDEVAAALLGRGVELLCEPSRPELVAALAVAGRIGRAAGPSGSWHEDEGERLQALNEEVARIAELLARLAGRNRDGNGGGTGGGGNGGVGDRHIGFGFEPAPRVADPHALRQAIRGRRMRDAFFGQNLFEDPAWDMLLDLYAAHLEGARVSVSSLCIAAAVAPTTALRWIGKLTEAELFERQPDPDDRRRAFMALTTKALGGMDAYLAALRRAGIPLA